MTPGDETLVRECLDGDGRAFELLLGRYERQVFNAALKMVNDRDDARDITQSVFLKAYEKLGDFNPKYRFFSWIYKITINESLNFIQRRKPVDPVDDQIPAGGRGPDASVHDSELSKIVQSALMSLKPDYRTVIILRHFHECSYREMSDILGAPEKTVKSRLFSARRILRGLVPRKGILSS